MSEDKSEATKIWEEIKDVQLDLFGLPDQTVQKNCTPVPVEDSKLYLLIPVSAAYPALDVALSKNFTIEMVGKWYTVSRKVKDQ